MAVVDLYANEWFNADGLLVLTGADEGLKQRSGEYSDTSMGRHCVEVTVALASLPAFGTSNKQILDPTVMIPAGAFIEEVDVLVLKETTGANANFNLGLVDQDRSTEIDFDGLLAAADAFNGGTDLGTYTEYFVGTTEAGALIGTKVTNTGYLVGWADTADFSAGVIKVRVFYSVNASADY